MKRTIKSTLTLVSAVVAAFSVGCAPMTEAERLEREYARVEFREAFRVERDLCTARGGTFVYDGVAELDRNGIPKTRVWFDCG